MPESILQLQYIYDKPYRDDCDICSEHNHTDSIYCLCQNNNFLTRSYIYCCASQRDKNTYERLCRLEKMYAKAFTLARCNT